MSKQWQELKETIVELRDGDGTGTQQEVCKFLANYMDILEKQMQEPCDDTISRKAAINAMIKIEQDDIDRYGCKIPEGFDSSPAIEALNGLPPVTPQPKMGRWIAYEVRLPDRTILNYRCSVCGRKLIGYSTETLSEAPFCHCGAKMVEPQER